ncbi:hypothetical protein Tco_1144349 [Tanacetum coccineum]
MMQLVALRDLTKIVKCNLRLSSDVTSKEATLQVVYDVLKLTPFYKAFQVTADAPEIYMQEFWASAYVHNRSVRFKMNNKKHILGLDQFRDILQICPKVGNKKFEEPPLEKEILAFLASLGHSGDIRKITDVNVNKLHQPWRSFAAIINKCLSDFIFQIENKNTKKGNAMYYPRFTKLVVNFVMDKDPSIPRRNKVNWHYARDDPMFTTINNIMLLLPGKIPPKMKEVEKADTDTTIKDEASTKAEQLKIITKRSRQETHSSHASGSGADEGTGVTPGVPNVPDYDSEADISWKSSDDDNDEKAQDDDDEERTEFEDDGDDFIHPKLTTHDDEIIHEEETDDDDSFNPTIHTPSHISSSDDEDSDKESFEGSRCEGAKSMKMGTHERVKEMKAVEDTNTNHEEEMRNVRFQLKYDSIREESNTANQQFLDSIDEGMKKVIKEQVKKEVSKITPKIEKLVIDQLESEVLVRSSKEANTSHAVAANLSELELKKILIDKMEA